MGLVIVKLGGSIITRKRETSTLRRKVLTHLARELREGSGKGANSLIVLHGAGSFGHPYAKEWNLSHAPKPEDRDRLRGAAITSVHVRQLHDHVLKSLIDAGLPALSIPPQTLATNDQGKLTTFEDSAFRTALEAGAVPVSFGDVVRDRSWGFSILSGDDIAVYLAEKLRAERVIFVSDVPGVLDQGKASSVVPHLTPGVVESLQPTPGVPDVTGGIRGKAEKMLKIAAGGTPCVILSGLSRDRLKQALQGEKVYGTWT